ncbi:MAG: VanR-ABDEGLN family response regulator transcription factor [Lachnospiraceae bacterium]|jgi:two-component system response regulator VanR|nr:VanR-ABDEGLN family response regulator transcription factor [Lachnospiraceae bacterium]
MRAEKNILIVDDEEALADLVEFYLKNEGYTVYKFYTGAEALQCISTTRIDLALLDVMLPDIDGFELCRRIRKKHHFPVIMLTAKEEELDKITGLTIGADDYITKPFRPLEVMARVKAQLRRYTHYNTGEGAGGNNDQMIQISGLMIDRVNHECFLNEKKLSLTPTEFEVLWTLCRHKGQVVSAEKMFAEIWGEKYYSNSSSTIMVHIRHLREKMGEDAEHPRYIKTVWGVGYKIG